MLKQEDGQQHQGQATIQFKRDSWLPLTAALCQLQTPNESLDLASNLCHNVHSLVYDYSHPPMTGQDPARFMRRLLLIWVL